MSVKIDIPWFLQYLVNGAGVARVDGSTVGECIKHLVERFPVIEKELFDNKGKLFTYIDIYINGESAYPEELAKPVKDGDELYITLIIGGG